LWLAILASVAAGQTDEPPREPPKREGPPPKILFLTHSAGFVHEVVKRESPDKLSFAEQSLIEAARGRYDVFATQDCAELAPERLSQYSGIVFYTTGELPMPPAHRTALVEWVRHGGAFAGIHCASDTFYEFPPYQRMIGGVFDGHPWKQKIRVEVADGAHPATAMLETGFEIDDEIYQFREFTRTPLNVLLSLEPTSADLSKGSRADRDYALAWCRDWGEGRVFYTALGHEPAVWKDPRFLGHLLGGIDWAVQKIDWYMTAPRGGTELTGAFRGLDAWRGKSAESVEGGWTSTMDSIICAPGAGPISSHVQHGDARLHVEFRLPAAANGSSARPTGGGGIALQGRYEIRLVDSARRKAGPGECGSFEGGAAPATEAWRQAGEWQSCDIEFRAPRFDDQDRRTEKARASVWLNGILVHERVDLAGPTPGAPETGEAAFGPLALTDRGGAVEYRNIWFLSLDSD
jgi:type 1 glutamine amidotransferase